MILGRKLIRMSSRLLSERQWVRIPPGPSQFAREVLMLEYCFGNAEVASSSLVVPANFFNHIRCNSEGEPIGVASKSGPFRLTLSTPLKASAVLSHLIFMAVC